MTKPEGISNDEPASAAWNSCFRFLSSFDIRIMSFHLHPLPCLRRFHGRIRHGLRARALVKIRGARTFIADPVGEFKSLIVAGGPQWIPPGGTARGTGAFPKFLGDSDRLQPRRPGFSGVE